MHPRPTPNATLEALIGGALDVPLLPFAAWFARLRDTPSAPAHRILLFYEWIGEVMDAGQFSEFSGARIERARAMSRTLDALPALGEKDVHAWIGYWRSVGALAGEVESDSE